MKLLDALAPAVLSALQRGGAGVAFALAGGGSSAVAALAGCEGASAVLIAGQLAYSRSAAAGLRRFEHSGGFASPAMALDLAHTALDSADQFDDRDRNLRIGIGVASALATDPPRSGRDRAYLAVTGNGPARCWRLDLDAWPGDRAHQELLTAAGALLAAWRGAGGGPCEPAWPAGLGQALTEQAADPAYWVGRVVGGRWPWARCDSAGGWAAGGKIPQGILAGSFNPLHEGHLGLAAAASESIGAPVELELSLQNVDKDPLDPAVATDRIRTVTGRAPLIIDAAATFAEKSRLFPGAVFVVGADTAARIVDPKYSGGDRAAMRSDLNAIRAAGNRFLVSGRRIDARYVRFDQLDLSAAPDLFKELPESAFRLDVSSTQIRAGDVPSGVG